MFCLSVWVWSLYGIHGRSRGYVGFCVDCGVSVALDCIIGVCCCAIMSVVAGLVLGYCCWLSWSVLIRLTHLEFVYGENVVVGVLLLSVYSGIFNI